MFALVGKIIIVIAIVIILIMLLSYKSSKRENVDTSSWKAPEVSKKDAYDFWKIVKLLGEIYQK